MVRGTNKLIIEVNDIDNRFFEKAILYVRENAGLEAGQSLEQQANQYIATMKNGTKVGFFRVATVKRVLQMGLCALMGSMFTLLLLTL